MKPIKFLLFSILQAAIVVSASAQEYKIVTVVESIVPGGIGRSRMIDMQQKVNYKEFTTEHENHDEHIKRQDIKVDNFEETKLLNFYSVTGINFENIASNDAVIISKINELTKEGWQLVNIIGGVESDAGRHDHRGIFVSRLIFKKSS